MNGDVCKKSDDPYCRTSYMLHMYTGTSMRVTTITTYEPFELGWNMVHVLELNGVIS